MLGIKSNKTFALLALLISGTTTAYAGTLLPVQQQPVFVTVPTSDPGFTFSVSALALQPGASNLNYVIYNKELPAQTPTWNEQEFKPSFSFGFELGAGYNFGQGNDVNLDWTHFQSNTSATTIAPNASYFLGPDYEIGPNGTTMRNAYGNAKFNYDVVNLDAGQWAALGKHIAMRFFGGLSTSFLREKVTAIYNGSIPAGLFAGPFSMEQQVKADFTGIGPRFGLEGDYTADNGFGFMMEGAFSALIGSAYAKTSFAGSGQELLALYNQTLNEQYIRDQKVSRVVPGVDGKLALTYKRTFNKNTSINISAGYEAAVYVNAISQYLPGTLVTGTSLQSGGIYVATMDHTLSNYSVQGPFLKASLQFS